MESNWSRIGVGLESDHDLEKILGVRLELEFKSMEPDWIRTPKKVTPLISGKQHTSTLEFDESPNVGNCNTSAFPSEFWTTPIPFCYFGQSYKSGPDFICGVRA